MNLDQQIQEKFSCAKCQHQQAKIKRIAVSGTGLSRMFDIEHNRFIAVSCTNCGYTEFYNPEFLEGKDNLGNILDVLFG